MRVLVGITGSIAAFESVRLVREMGKLGRQVDVILTRDAQRFVSIEALQRAARSVSIEVSPKAEHVEVYKYDAYVIYPATLNTLSKIANGIADTIVTLYAQTAIGYGVPVIVVPAMHTALRLRATDAIRRLIQLGVHIVYPKPVGDRMRIAGFYEVIGAVIEVQPKRRPRILVTAGPTMSYIDPIRVITNPSSGRLGAYIAERAFERMHETYLVTGGHVMPRYPQIPVIRVRTNDELLSTVLKLGSRVDALIMSAAPADFETVKAAHKLPSDRSYTIELRPGIKVVEEFRKRYPDKILVVFKAESDEKRALERGRELLEKYSADLCVADTPKAFGSEDIEALLITRNGIERFYGSKRELADKIVDYVESAWIGRRG